MRSYSCFVENFEERALFVGCLLNSYDKGLDRVRKSQAFQSLLISKLAEFDMLYDYTKESLEKYFGRFV